MGQLSGSDPDRQYGPVVPAHGFAIRSTTTADTPPTTEYIEFEKFWQEYAKTLNQRATLVWQELCWAGWWARSEVAEGREPTIFPRKEGE